jgi:hypothetical protein
MFFERALKIDMWEIMFCPYVRVCGHGVRRSKWPVLI